MSFVVSQAGHRRVPLFKPPHQMADLRLRWDRLLVLGFLLSFWTSVGAAIIRL